MSFTTICSKVRKNSVPTIHRSLSLVIPTFTESAMFLPCDESDMRWHAMFIIKSPFVIGTLHLEGLFEFFYHFKFYRDTISPKSQRVCMCPEIVSRTLNHNFSVAEYVKQFQAKCGELTMVLERRLPHTW
jgi:hypothetical protein